tara:strand:+ start:165 stop:395 length:231 start_codon:yes stop_codon:yes gene_type:complete
MDRVKKIKIIKISEERYDKIMNHINQNESDYSNIKVEMINIKEDKAWHFIYYKRLKEIEEITGSPKLNGYFSNSRY